MQRTFYSVTQRRLMTTSKRVQDRSKRKRIRDLEMATERSKVLSKVLFVMEILKQEPEQIISMRSLDQYRRQINLPKPHRMTDFIGKSPKLFELYKDEKGVLWCGMTAVAEGLLREEAQIMEDMGEKVAEYVARMLMMSVDKRLAVDKIAHFRRDMGLPLDFRSNWVFRYPKLFRVVRSGEDETEYLELVRWDPCLAVTELEKKTLLISGSIDQTPGVLTLPFPLQFPPNYKQVFRYGGQIEHFQKRPYLSPYADARELKAGSLEFDKRAVAVMHELLSFTVEKKLVTDHLTHFRRELVMPQKLMRLLLKHFGIFYVSERGKRFSVFLKEAYSGMELLEKCPLVRWREKVLSLTGYRGRNLNIQSYQDFPESAEDDLYQTASEEEEEEEEEVMGGLDDGLHTDSELDVGDLQS